jgi:hypothetical protein
MTLSKSLMALTAVAGLAVAGPALAQTDPHHPSGAETAQQSPPAGQPPAPGGSSSPGMTMPGGGMPMMGMMNMMGMMGMMGQGGSGMSDMGMHGMDMRGMATVDRVEGRIAFLRAELKITDAQAKVWDQFAQSLRDNAKRLADVRAAVAKSAGASMPTLVQRLDSQDRWLAARLEGVRAIRITSDHLYTALSADQKKTADELLGAHMGLMPSGIMSMSMMPMGGMMMPMGGNVR